MRLTSTLSPWRARCCAHVGAGDLVLLPRSSVTITTSTRLARCEERHGVGDGARGRAAAVPAHHDAVELERRFLDVRHDDDRPAGLEQRGFGDHSSTALLSGSACPTTDKSKRRASRPNCSPAPPAALSVSGSAETPARAAAGVEAVVQRPRVRVRHCRAPAHRSRRRGCSPRPKLERPDRRGRRCRRRCASKAAAIETAYSPAKLAALTKAEIDDDVLDHGADPQSRLR